MSIKRRIKWIVLKSGISLPLLPISPGLSYISYLTQALSWCRLNLKSSPGKFRNIEMDFHDRLALYEFLLNQYRLYDVIDYLEFGVYLGESIRWWVDKNKKAESRFIGFDTFTGLPEDWDFLKQGTYTAQGEAPSISDGRVNFVKGLFQQTLGGFISTYSNDRRKVVHLDADLYSSTLFVLTRLAPILRQNDILIFDEFLAWKHPTHEYRAFCDFISAYRINSRLIGAADGFAHVAILIL